ncbi:protein ECERIFERUM 2-like isoform X1 [Abrus precatorius]|uniref:Protein ECERIFERUM 2-like isoform X1 n=1 Tax=Abrus precatorius TaxID=3816 RepID=A0A8B8JKH2_ABRPR|nr:protein ECERIFERUM 2-like isoform X1 [Abrus precatorius]
MEENQPPLSSKISTVVPATSRRDENSAWHLSNMDLLVKLHYIRAVYFFINDAALGLSICDLKEPMFLLLDDLAHLSGRIRVEESGRAFIKCNDAGVRIAESHSDMILEEWFNQNGYSTEDLVHDHMLGPDLGFSPLVFVKFTWFKCGGLCVGLSWSHVLGDAFSAFNFINKWSQILSGQMPPKSLLMPNHKEAKFLHNSNSGNPISVKRAKIVEQHWLATNDTKMGTHSFHINSEQLDHLVTSAFPCGENQITNNPLYFETLSALLWKYIARIRGGSEPKIVTICTYGTDYRKIDDVPTNGLVLSIVEANVVVGKSDVSDLAKLIAEEKKAENSIVEMLVEEKEGTEDFTVYGANLTFVNLEEAKIYEANLNGQKPIVANCSIHGVGNQGAVLVLPAPEDNKGRMITVSLPENELDQLKDKLGGEWGVASHLF